jgi:hypothetical protein
MLRSAVSNNESDDDNKVKWNSRSVNIHIHTICGSDSERKKHAARHGSDGFRQVVEQGIKKVHVIGSAVNNVGAGVGYRNNEYN